MIAKRVDKKGDIKGSLKGLIKYISNDQGNEERIKEDVRITNCLSNDLDCAIAEMQVVQNMNHKCKEDKKTYHLVISFHKDDLEKLDSHKLHDIEDRVVKSLGFQDCQRVSVIHGDTDEPHIHVAINTIHPKTFKRMNTWQDQVTLRKICKEIEREYGLTETAEIKTEQTYSKSENKTRDFENATGDKSLLTTLKELHLENIFERCNSWRDIHIALARLGINLHKRGNGLVFSSNGVSVKASSVNRDFSLKNLEKRFGSFEKLDDETIKDNWKKDSCGYRSHSITKVEILEIRRINRFELIQEMKDINQNYKLMNNLMNMQWQNCNPEFAILMRYFLKKWREDEIKRAIEVERRRNTNMRSSNGRTKEEHIRRQRQQMNPQQIFHNICERRFNSNHDERCHDLLSYFKNLVKTDTLKALIDREKMLAILKQRQADIRRQQQRRQEQHRNQNQQGFKR